MIYLTLILTMIQLVIYLVSGYILVTTSVSTRLKKWVKEIIIEALDEFFNQN